MAKSNRTLHIAAFCLLAVFCFDSFETNPDSWSPHRLLRATVKLLDPTANLVSWDDVEKYHEEKESTPSEEGEAPSKPPFHPVFWHVPKAGGTSLQDMMSACLMLVTANHVGYGYYDQSDELKIVPEGEDPKIGHYINVDLSTREGIEHAVDIGLPEHLDMVDVMVTSELQSLTQKVLSKEEKGMIFTILRHPVERAVSTFYYLKKADWEPTYSPEWQDWTVKEYADSGEAEKNWMMAVLLGESHPMNDDSLELAKELLRNHTVIGLLDEMEESIRRFGRVFGWDEQANFEPCVGAYTTHPSNSNKHPPLDPEGEEWQMLAEINNYDMQLYEYAVELFKEQGATFFGYEEASEAEVEAMIEATVDIVEAIAEAESGSDSAADGNLTVVVIGATDEDGDISTGPDDGADGEVLFVVEAADPEAVQEAEDAADELDSEDFERSAETEDTDERKLGLMSLLGNDKEDETVDAHDTSVEVVEGDADGDETTIEETAIETVDDKDISVEAVEGDAAGDETAITATAIEAVDDEDTSVEVVEGIADGDEQDNVVFDEEPMPLEASDADVEAVIDIVEAIAESESGSDSAADGNLTVVVFGTTDEDGEIPTDPDDEALLVVVAAADPEEVQQTEDTAVEVDTEGFERKIAEDEVDGEDIQIDVVDGDADGADQEIFVDGINQGGADPVAEAMSEATVDVVEAAPDDGDLTLVIGTAQEDGETPVDPDDEADGALLVVVEDADPEEVQQVEDVADELDAQDLEVVQAANEEESEEATDSGSSSDEVEAEEAEADEMSYYEMEAMAPVETETETEIVAEAEEEEIDEDGEKDKEEDSEEDDKDDSDEAVEVVTEEVE